MNQIETRNRTAVGLIITLMFAQCLTAAVANSQEKSVVLDGNSKGRVFDGIGAVSAGASSRLLIDYPEPQRSQILDYLFKPGYGAALQHLKVEIGADVDSTDGTEPSHMRSAFDHDSARGYEWWLMTEAHKRNPEITLEILPWGAPGWVGKNTLYTPQMAEYVADFIRTAKRVYGLNIAYAGLWNEKVYSIPYIKELHRRFKVEHLTTRIICCDEYPGQGAGQWAIADEILKNPEVAEAIDVIGVHLPEDGKIATRLAARKTSKPLWSSEEDQPAEGASQNWPREWLRDGRVLAHTYNANYLERSLTLTEIWSPITSYYDNLPDSGSGLMYANTPWSGHYSVQSAIWVTAHTTQFTQPGWRYLDSGSGYLQEKGSYVALRSSDKKYWSVILETIGANRPQAVSFRLKGGLAAATVHIWETNHARTFEYVAKVKPIDGTFKYTFDPDSLYSLTTTTGQGKGLARPPRSKGFPLPYTDDFENTRLRHTPKYLSDQNGAFEVHPCAGRQGQCLEQVITAKPIPWGPMPDPYTLAGDTTWMDYSVAADVHFLSAAPAIVMGRIDSADSFKDVNARWPSGYMLRLELNGAWKLFSAEFKKPTVTLASGSVTLDRNQWHHMELRFVGKRIAASLDGTPLASIETSAHTHGMFGLGTEWNRVQFDNLRVAP